MHWLIPSAICGALLIYTAHGIYADLRQLRRPTRRERGEPGASTRPRASPVITTIPTTRTPTMKSSPLPDPDALTIQLNTDRDGMRFEVRCGSESIHEAKTPVMSPRAAERRGRAWIQKYSDSSDHGRCRLCGFDWPTVSRALTRHRHEEASRA